MFFYVLQVLVPVGYMPASLAEEGALIKLCPSGVSDSVMAVLHKGHISHSDHSSTAESNDAHESHHAIKSSAMLFQNHHQHAHHHGHHRLSFKGEAHSGGGHHAGHHYGHHDSQHASPHSSHGDSSHDSHDDSDHADHNATNLCDYASASFSSDFALPPSNNAEEIEQNLFKQQLLRHNNIVSLLHRKQRSRAPPSA